MSVLQFSRRREVLAEPMPLAVELEQPFPFREVADNDLASDQPSKPKFKLSQSLRRALIAFGLLVAALAYPASVIMATKLGGPLMAPDNLRQNWSVQWVGVGVHLITQEMQENGWAPGAQSWKPEARLTAKPAYQSALMQALGSYASLVSSQSGPEGDSDLNTVGRVLAGRIGVDEVRAARTALESYDARVRIHRASSDLSAKHFAERILLTADWTKASSKELITLNRTTDDVLSEKVSAAVYRARARGAAAFSLLSVQADGFRAHDIEPLRLEALNALEKIANFEPFFVLNGAPDGSVAPSHVAGMYFLLAQAEVALEAYAEKLTQGPIAQGGAAG